MQINDRGAAVVEIHLGKKYLEALKKVTDNDETFSKLEDLDSTCLSI